MTPRQVGGAIGIALLGSLLAGTAGESVVAARLVAERAGSAELAASANSAYVHGMGVALLVCGIAALVSALLAAAFLPGTPDGPEPEAPDMAAERADARQ